MTFESEELGYRLKPYSKGPCWQLHRLAKDDSGKPIPGEWRPIEFYPSTFEYGLRNIVERALRESKECGGVQTAIAEFNRVGATIMRALEVPQPAE